jgi:hypothetical protein
MDKVFCDQLQPKTKIRVIKRTGEIEDFVIKKMIIMQCYHEEHCKPDEIYDIEILLNKKKNIYFSYTMYLHDMSWVKDIEILK